MYQVSRTKHKKHGDVVEITKEDNGPFPTPFQAIQSARKERRLWLESGCKKVKILIDEQIHTVQQAETWANEEYKLLPKCQSCSKILDGDVYTHQLCGSDLFCSQSCADQNYSEKTEVDNDESEFECF